MSYLFDFLRSRMIPSSAAMISLRSTLDFLKFNRSLKSLVGARYWKTNALGRPAFLGFGAQRRSAIYCCLSCGRNSKLWCPGPDGDGT